MAVNFNGFLMSRFILKHLLKILMFTHSLFRNPIVDQMVIIQV